MGRLFCQLLFPKSRINSQGREGGGGGLRHRAANHEQVKIYVFSRQTAVKENIPRKVSMHKINHNLTFKRDFLKQLLTAGFSKQEEIVHLFGTFFSGGLILVSICGSRTMCVMLSQNKLDCVSPNRFWTTVELYGTEEGDISGSGHTDNTS